MAGPPHGRTAGGGRAGPAAGSRWAAAGEGPSAEHEKRYLRINCQESSQLCASFL
jgi:hypothetical protein